MKSAAGQTAAPAESTPDSGFGRRAPKTPPGSVTAPAVQSTPASPHKAAASSPSPSKSAASEQGGPYVTIDFDNVDIQVFIKFVSELTGRNFVIDDKVKGKVTVISPNKISVDEVYKVFESVLEIYGFTTVDAGDVTKVVLALDARGKNVDLRLKPEAVDPEDKIVTQILSLQHASPDEMKKVLDPLISKNSIILAYAPTGMLIITDVSSNIKRLQEIVTALDVEGVGEMISYIPLQSASATEIVKSLIAVFAPQRPGSAPIRIVADERTNSIILLASETNTMNVKKLISLMDKDIPRSGTILHVYRLQNGNAEDMTKVLMNLPKDTKDPEGRPAPTPATGEGRCIVQGCECGSGQGDQHADHHGEPGRLQDARGDHPSARRTAADGLHRGADHGGVGQQELQHRGRMARPEGCRQRQPLRVWGRTRPVWGWPVSAVHPSFPR